MIIYYYDIHILQEVTSREWQGVIYIMLDLLSDFGVKYAQTVEVYYISHVFLQLPLLNCNTYLIYINTYLMHINT